ncbi:MAG: hypothetical protein HY595_04595 [Candidatus Omnitrophica bacterium]|nr:hypothetical protein [Candidatus Omnitrophota bacterium]
MRSYDDSRIEFVTLPRNVAQSRRLPVEPADAARPGLDPSTPPPLAGSLTSCRAQHSVRGRMSPEPMGLHKLKVIRSTIPAVTHVDGSARLQTVRHETNPLFYEIIKAFDQLTSCPVVINTSFNIRGEPIVATPEDAYRCFMRTQMDALVLESFVLTKDQQPFGALELAEAVAVGLD